MGGVSPFILGDARRIRHARLLARLAERPVGDARHGLLGRRGDGGVRENAALAEPAAFAADGGLSRPVRRPIRLAGALAAPARPPAVSAGRARHLDGVGVRAVIFSVPVPLELCRLQPIFDADCGANRRHDGRVRRLIFDSARERGRVCGHSKQRLSQGETNGVDGGRRRACADRRLRRVRAIFFRTRRRATERENAQYRRRAGQY